jgi:hypothetical protein
MGALLNEKAGGMARDWIQVLKDGAPAEFNKVHRRPLE